jgi:hypothetical protein
VARAGGALETRDVSAADEPGEAPAGTPTD